MNDFEHKSIELREQKSSLEAKIDRLKTRILKLDADIVVIEKYAFEVPSKVKEMKMKGLNLQGLTGAGKIRKSAVNDHGLIPTVRKKKMPGERYDDDDEGDEEDVEGDSDEEGEGDDSDLNDLRDVSEEVELSELKPDLRIPQRLFSNLPKQRLMEGSSNRSERKRLHDKEEKEDGETGESAKKRR